MYEVRVERAFEASHRRAPDGSETEPHEHRWRVAVRVESEELNQMAIVIDFRRVRDLLDEIVDPLRGTVLEDHPELGGAPTTPLALAEWLADKVATETSRPPCRLVAVEVEADAGVVYEFRPESAGV
jgi:6-pyruvoyltetrahydropterin/6-carboxytetrahydropterin synthase